MIEELGSENSQLVEVYKPNYYTFQFRDVRIMNDD